MYVIECDLELNIPQPKTESYVGDGVRSNHPKSKRKAKDGQNSLYCNFGEVWNPDCGAH